MLTDLHMRLGQIGFVLGRNGATGRARGCLKQIYSFAMFKAK